MHGSYKQQVHHEDTDIELVKIIGTPGKYDQRWL